MPFHSDFALNNASILRIYLKKNFTFVIKTINHLCSFTCNDKFPIRFIKTSDPIHVKYSGFVNSVGIFLVYGEYFLKYVILNLIYYKHNTLRSFCYLRRIYLVIKKN